MINEWAELGMVLPVETLPDAAPFRELRVEQGRSHAGGFIDDKQDPKFHLTGKVEDLFEEKPATEGGMKGVLSLPTPSTPAPPPKRSYRQGEI